MTDGVQGRRPSVARHPRPTRRAIWLGAVVLLLTLSSCSDEELPPPASFSSGEPVGEESDGIASLRASIDAVDAAMRDAARALETDDEVAADGIRTVEVCEPGAFSGTKAIEIRARGRLVGGSGPLVPRLKAASRRMQQAGWKQAGADLTGEDPGIGMTKDGAQIVLGKDAIIDGDAIYFGAGGPCYRVEDGGLGAFRGTTMIPLSDGERPYAAEAPLEPDPSTDPADGERLVQESIKDYTDALLDAADALRTADETPRDGYRSVDRCEPSPVMSVYVTGDLEGGYGSIRERLDRVRPRLNAAGWTAAGDEFVEDELVLHYVKDGVTLEITTNAVADGGGLAFTARGPCYPVEREVVRQLSEITPIEFAP